MSICTCLTGFWNDSLDTSNTSTLKGTIPGGAPFIQSHVRKRQAVMLLCWYESHDTWSLITTSFTFHPPHPALGLLVLRCRDVVRLFVRVLLRAFCVVLEGHEVIEVLL